jgi:hypothetical protein
MVIEGIAQNTSGSIFEPEVSLYLYFPPFVGQSIAPAWHLHNLLLFFHENKHQFFLFVLMLWISLVATDFCSMSQGGQAPEVTGSPTEKAILSWGLQVQIQPLSSLSLDPFYCLIGNDDLHISTARYEI